MFHPNLVRFSGGNQNQNSRKTIEGSWPFNLNPTSSSKSGIAATNSMVNLKLKKDRPMTSKVRADANRKQGINRPMTAK